MQLTVWTYEGPPHVGAMRIATALTDVHYVLHAPQGDTYADLLFTMIERLPKRPPVTYTTFQARDLGSDTAELFRTAAREAYERFTPSAMLVGASCTAELIQDDPGGLAQALHLPVPVIALELPSYQRKENWGAAETFYQLVRTLADPAAGGRSQAPEPSARPSCNLLGPTALGFRHRDDVHEVTRLLESIGVSVNVVAPMGACAADLARLPQAGFNVVLYPEVANPAAAWLQRRFGQPHTRVVPIGVGATRDFIREVAGLAGLDPEEALAQALAAARSHSPWYTRSVDSTYLTGKRVFIFGDATHVLGALRVAREELGFEVVGLGTYSRELAREVREAARQLGLEALITDDYLDIEEAVAALAPDLVLGTQMERHMAKRLGIPCAVISAPVHVQDFPARYCPQMGFEGANVLFDTWVHPLMMGLEEHLIGMFRGDFEFHEDAAPSHLGTRMPGAGHLGANRQRTDALGVEATPGGNITPPQTITPIGPVARAAAAHIAPNTPNTPTTHPAPLGSGVSPARAGAGTGAGSAPGTGPAAWSPEAEHELRKIPFFVRGKARRNTERFALDRGLAVITLETLYDAKAHFSR